MSKKILFWPDVYKEQGHWLPTLTWAKGLFNLKDDEVEFLEEPEDLDEAELNAEMEGLIEQANAFYDREIARFEEE